jgi:hypothetical protein
MFKYGREWGAESSLLTIELTCYRHRLMPKDGGLGPLQHFKNAYALAFPEKVQTWNSWTELLTREFVEVPKGSAKAIGISGASGTGKSFHTGDMVLLDFLSAPDETTVLVASTDLASLEKRCWSNIRQSHSICPVQIGKYMASRPPRIALEGDSLHGIFAATVLNYEQRNSIIGFHPKNLIILLDEATEMPAELLNLWPNWTSAGKTFRLLATGNAKSPSDLHGALCTPVNGWDSIDFDHDVCWKTKWGSAILLDGERSPVVKRPELQKKLFFLKSKEQVEDLKAKLGAKSPHYLRYVRSHWVTDSLSKTILDRKTIERTDATGSVRWSSKPKKRLAALDPSLGGGDMCCLRFADLGYSVNGVQVLDFGGESNVIDVRINSYSNEPISFQIVEQVIKLCEREGVEPEDFIGDFTAIGISLGDLFESQWGPINRMVASERPDDDMIMPGKSARDIYYNRVTQLWFDFREFVMSGQIKGLDDAAVNQFCTRLYDDTGQKLKLQPKLEYKKMVGTIETWGGSPDQADCATYMLYLAKLHGFELTQESPMVLVREDPVEMTSERYFLEMMHRRKNAPIEAEKINLFDYNYGSKK